MKRKEPHDRTESGRRQFLRGAGAALLGLPALGTAATATDESGPTVATGQRIHRYVPDGDVYRHEERFVSEALREAYGKATFVYDEGSIARETVPADYRNPDRPVVVKYRDTAVVGTFKEFRRTEQQTKEQASDDANALCCADYDGPLYVYKSSVSNPSPGDLGEATGPINVGWEDSIGRSAAEINSYMRDRGWTSMYAGDPGTRYVILHYYNSTTLYAKPQDDHIVKGLSVPTTQYHVRAYDLPDHSDPEMAVVGQAHKDPEFHQGPPWNFSEARQAVSDDWDNWGYNIALDHVSNGGDYGTSDGFFDRIYS